MSDSSPAASNSWLTLGGVVAILVILSLTAVLLLPVAMAPHSRHYLDMGRGVELYKAIFAQVLENPGAAPALFPTRSEGYSSSTRYFQDLLDRKVLRVPATFFSGPGLARPADNNSTTLLPSENAWSVVLDVEDQIASTPFLLSRNFLADRIRLPSKAEPLTPDLLAEPNARHTLEFDGQKAVIITKAGTGFYLKVAKLEAGARAEVFNPGDHRGLILRP